MSEEPTTPDLIGLARLFNDAFNRRDWDAVESFYAPDAVAVAAEGLGTFEGTAPYAASTKRRLALAMTSTTRSRRSSISATESLSS
jgi:ketosteroid isomerase-like protein